eukprot:6085601-Prymnesium_polylepis.2
MSWRCAVADRLCHVTDETQTARALRLSPHTAAATASYVCRLGAVTMYTIRVLAQPRNMCEHAGG